MTPLITKFNSNSVLYDSLGDVTQKYISMIYDHQYIYFLMDNTGGVIIYDTLTEEISSINLINKVTENNSIVLHKNQLYGFNGYNAKKFVNDTVLYIKDNNKLIQESYNREINVTHLYSSTQIRDFMIDEDMNYYVIHNKNTISKFTKDRILLYTTTINAYNSALSSLLVSDNVIDILKIDMIREYTDNGVKSYPIILGRVQNEILNIRSGELFLAKFDETTQSISYAAFAGLTGEYIPYGNVKRINYNLTNYDYLRNTYSNDNILNFRVTLKNVYNNKDKKVINIPINTHLFKSESHHFAFRFDGMNGIISVFCDGKEIQSVNIEKGKYIFQDILNESISVGNTYFYNNITLDKYLNQPNYYFVNNSSIKHFKMYKKALTNNEIDFHIHYNNGVQDLIISLPCDQRNELDGIERQFRLDTTGNKSNKVNIIVKNSQLTNESLQNKLKLIIEEKLKKTLPITTVINNIEFR